MHTRREDREKWEEGRLDKAIHGDWKILRATKQIQQTWEPGFAESTAGEPHEAIHSHLQEIYEGTGLEEWNIEGHTEQQVEPFTMRELEEATARGKLGKSVGPDGIPREPLIQVVGSSCYRGAEVLGTAQLHTGNRRLPQDWSAVIMVVLPKVSQPTYARYL